MILSRLDAFLESLWWLEALCVLFYLLVAIFQNPVFVLYFLFEHGWSVPISSPTPNPTPLPTFWAVVASALRSVKNIIWFIAMYLTHQRPEPLSYSPKGAILIKRGARLSKTQTWAVFSELNCKLFRAGTISVIDTIDTDQPMNKYK